MSKTATYSLIASTTLGTAAASYTFSSIPGTFTDLILVCSMQSTTNTNTDARYFLQVGNGTIDTGSNYSLTQFNGTGSSAVSVRSTNRTQVDGVTYNATSNNGDFAIATFHLMDYANTFTYKTILQRANQNLNTYDPANNFVGAGVSLWRSTSAINTIKVLTGGPSPGNFSIGSTFKLYGIQAVN